MELKVAMQGPAPSEASLTFSGTQFLHASLSIAARLSLILRLSALLLPRWLQPLEVQTWQKKGCFFSVSYFVRNLYQALPQQTSPHTQRSHWVIYPHLNYTLRREMRLPRLTLGCQGTWENTRTLILTVKHSVHWNKSRALSAWQEGYCWPDSSWCYRPAGLSRSYSYSFCTHISSLV